MTTIRPNLLPPGGQGPQAQPHDQNKLAAQRAFFEAALRQAGGPGAPQAASVVQNPAAAAAPRATAGAAPSGESPQRILRPGSLIDIRV